MQTLAHNETKFDFSQLPEQDLTEDENLITIPEFEGSAVRKGDAVVLKPQSMADPGLELPTINPRYSGKHHRFFYASGTYDSGYYKNAVRNIHVNSFLHISYNFV